MRNFARMLEIIFEINVTPRLTRGRLTRERVQISLYSEGSQIFPKRGISEQNHEASNDVTLRFRP